MNKYVPDDIPGSPIGEELVTITLTQREWTNLMRYVSTCAIDPSTNLQLREAAWPASFTIAKALGESIGVQIDEREDGSGLSFKKREPS